MPRELRSLDDLGPDEEWALIRFSRPDGLTWYVARDEAEAKKHARQRGDVRKPEGRAVFSNDEMLRLLDHWARQGKEVAAVELASLVEMKLTFGDAYVEGVKERANG